MFRVFQNGDSTCLRSVAYGLNSITNRVSPSRASADVVSRVEGRIEKRIRLAVPLKLSGMQDSINAESTCTENICSYGARVVTQKARGLDEQLRVTSPVGQLRMKARVVYCQPLGDRRFALGLHFEKPAGSLLSAREASGSD